MTQEIFKNMYEKNINLKIHEFKQKNSQKWRLENQQLKTKIITSIQYFTLLLYLSCISISNTICFKITNYKHETSRSSAYAL